MGQNMKQWFELATRAPVVRRACMYGVIVGAILIGINHGDQLLAGNVNSEMVCKMLLTMVVPYLVSTFSSVSAMRG